MCLLNGMEPLALREITLIDSAQIYIYIYKKMAALSPAVAIDAQHLGLEANPDPHPQPFDNVHQNRDLEQNRGQSCS